MLIELSKLKGLPVGVMDEARKGGEVSRVIFDYAQIKAIGLLIRPDGIWNREKVVSLSDIVSIDAGGAVIRSGDDIVERGEIVRIDEILKKKSNLIGLRAYNKESSFLGYVYDGVIESQTGDLVRVYVRFLWRKYIFGRSQIIKIDEKKVVFDTNAKISEGVEAVPRVAETA